MVLMHRWSPDHPVALHISDGPLESFMLVTEKEPPSANSSEGVSIFKEHRSTDWILEFRLTNKRFLTVFQSLYEDICECTFDADPSKAGEIMVDVYNNWRHAFNNKSNKLSTNEIQGLIGELVAIRDILLPKYDPRTVLKSWMLGDHGKQDFILQDTWLEVKTIRVGVESIHISSVEQLDCTNYKGTLAVIKLKTTSSNDPGHVTLNKLIGELYLIFSEDGYGSEFMSLMSEYGLPSDEYDCNTYSIISQDMYDVSDTFPRIKRSDLDSAIGRVEYDLSLHSITDYLR